MALTLLALLWAHHQSSDPFARYAKAHKDEKAFHVKLKGASGTMPMIDMELSVSRPGDLRFDMKAPGLDYASKVVGGEFADIDKTEHLYDEYTAEKKLGYYGSRINGLAGQLFPNFLLVSDLKDAFPAKANQKIERSKDGDLIKTHSESEQGQVDVECLVDDQGNIRRYKLDMKSPMQQVHKVWEISTYEPLSAQQKAALNFALPLGYVPYSVPSLSAPIERGSAAPLKGWTTKAGSVDLLKKSAGKRFLIAYLDDSVAGKAARAAIQKLKATVPVYVVGEDIFDKSGSCTQQLNPPATPMFYRIDAKGKVDRMWMGFDKANSDKWISDVKSMKGNDDE